MKHEDKPAFAQMMIGLSEYYGRALSEGMIGMYWQGLENFETKAVNEALNRHIRNPDSGQFMPKIADIVKMLSGSTQDSALIAWSKVDQGLRTVGVYESVVFDDPLIHRVLTDMGGWINLGNKNEDDWPFVAKEFENRYRGFTVRSERPDYPPVLFGMAEAQNNQIGFKTQPPRLIGDPDRARSVYQNGSSVQLGFERLNDSSASVTQQLIEKSKQQRAA
jgi:hypothetical protein